MPSFRTGVVRRVVERHAGLQVLEVDVGGEVRTAVLYTRYAATASAGDRVVVNTTAVELGLGTGGEDFVVWNLEAEEHDAPSGGHLMKLRYTPAQTDVLCVEAPESEHHATMASVASLEDVPVVVLSLHSQLVPAVAGARSVRPDARIVYVMTDGGALDVALSRTVRRLRELRWLAGTITAGHAIGGDLEAVTLYSGLLAARAVLRAELIVAGMGPGVPGTGTSFGTTGLELGTIVNATASLGGRPVACVRMSSADARERHAGVSHHARIALERVALARATIPVPLRVEAPSFGGGHDVVAVDTGGVLASMDSSGIVPTHMGRTPASDPLFFEAAGAAGIYAAGLL